MTKQPIPKVRPVGVGYVRTVVGLFLALVFLVGIVLIFVIAFQFGTVQSNIQIGGSIIFIVSIGGGAVWTKFFAEQSIPALWHVWDKRLLNYNEIRNPKGSLRVHLTAGLGIWATVETNYRKSSDLDVYNHDNRLVEMSDYARQISENAGNCGCDSGCNSTGLQSNL
jgi:hypothetical protein